MSIATRFGHHRTLAVVFAVLAAVPGPWRSAAQAQDDHPAVVKAQEISEAFRAVAQAARPSVARITGYTASGAKVGGSGFVIDPRGYLVTNNHVVESAASLIAEFSDGRIIPATLVGADPLTDLAVIRVNAEGLSALAFDSTNHIEVGQWVVAVGFPLGLDQTVTVGVISATNRRLNIVGTSVGRRGYEDFIQTDAAINRGNSGGPLLNLRGEVVGVNAAIVTQTGGSDGLGFAIPARLAGYITGELMSKRRVVRAWLGIGLQDLTPALALSYGLARDQNGVLLTSVNPDEPAGRAGLLPQDVLVSINGQTVRNVEDLRNQVAAMEPGRRVTVDAYREGRKRAFEVVLAEMNTPESERRPMINPAWGGRLGARFEDLGDGDLRSLGEQSGVLIAQLAPGRLGQLSGLTEGDIIVEVNGEALRSVADTQSNRRDRMGMVVRSSARWLYETLERAEAGSIFRFTVRRRMLDASGRFVGYDRVFAAVEIE